MQNATNPAIAPAKTRTRIAAAQVWKRYPADQVRLLNRALSAPPNRMLDRAARCVSPRLGSHQADDSAMPARRH
jgi:hypothetical protein